VTGVADFCDATGTETGVTGATSGRGVTAGAGGIESIVGI
jgi:hypothetical protein